ncbi:NADPH dehydrogenase [Microdochium trichocladiopsis]|uniref:NADPH dehydrogenase n=1 Tax=Microdochium trichocladiopsis TaxID=1682393 RepID=A0A9P8XR40_9PEZI|nr:NADPH dehydrogenase [Microdochium trichocladiopsis]KAH7012539.1 NADPH dehydrogenase [Microdochium trichocladiopsis]
MAEGYMTKDLLPNEDYNRNYARWSEGGWGMLITGNVMVDPKRISGPGAFVVNTAVDRKIQLDKYSAFARAAKQNGTKVLVQLCHPGRQALAGSGTKGLCEKSIAPSPIPLRLGDGIVNKILASMAFGTPREMTTADISRVVEHFADAAKLMAEADLDGIELHGAHGYLLSQFLSAESNMRTDEYGGSALKRAAMPVEVIKAVRAAVPSAFIIGFKLDSVDYQTTDELADCIEQFRAIAEAGVDFIEISGGTYGDPVMVDGPPKSSRTKAREAYFLHFAETFRLSFPNVPLMVTGGFHSRKGMEEAVTGGGTDLIGVGRAAVMEPSLPSEIMLNPNLPTSDAIVKVERYISPWYLNIGVKAIGVGYENAMYANKMSS